MVEKVCFVTGEIFKHHITSDYHPENPKRIIAIINFLRTFKYLNMLKMIEPEKATRELIELVHDPEYVEFIKVFAEAGGGHPLGDLDTVVSKRTYEVALYAAGTVVKTLRKVILGECKVGFAAIRPPGHHAHKGLAKGFCIFNNIAIAAKYLIENYGYKRVAILDIDVHHGDGTQSIFYNTSKVLYVSLHQDPRTLFPGTGFPEEVGEKDGEGYTINIPLPPGTSDAGYIFALKEVALPIIKQYKPEVLLISAGFDTHHSDMLADLNLTLSSYWKIGKLVFDGLKIADGALAVLEGGYSLNYLPKAIMNLVLAPYFNKPLYSESLVYEENIGKIRNYVERCRRIFKKYWEL